MGFLKLITIVFLLFFGTPLKVKSFYLVQGISKFRNIVWIKSFQIFRTFSKMRSHIPSYQTKSFRKVDNSGNERILKVLSRLRFKKIEKGEKIRFERKFNSLSIQVIFSEKDPIDVFLRRGNKRIHHRRLIRVNSIDRNLSSTIGNMMKVSLTH